MAKFQIGSYEHKKLFCALLDHPAEISGLPNLNRAEKDRLQAMKLWSFAVDQLDASAQVAKTLTNTATGSLMKNAIAQLMKSNRQAAKVLKPLAKGSSTFVKGQFKGGNADFIKISHQLNLSLFLAGGLVELAKQDDFISPDVLSKIEAILDQQAAHTVFFINWLAFQSQVNQKPEYEWAGVLALPQRWSEVSRLISMLNRSEYDDNLPENPTELEIFMGRWRLLQLLDACEQSYCRRFESFDPRLLRPTKLLKTCRSIHRILGFWPQRTIQSRVSST